MNNKALLDFLVVGTPRAATTWLYLCLRDHPQICLTEKKSYNPFDDEGNIQDKEINEKFQHCQKSDAVRGAMAYMLFSVKESSGWVKKHFPQIKVIMILRNPIERAYSQYKHNIARGVLKNVSFGESIRHQGIVMEQGLYADAVESYWRNVGRENTLILLHDDIMQNHASVLAQVQKFIGVDIISSEHTDSFISVSRLKRKAYHSEFLLNLHQSLLRMNTFAKQHLGTWVGTVTHAFGLGRLLTFIAIKNQNKQVDMGAEDSMEKASIAPEDRNFLQEYYKEDMTKLYKLLNRDLCWK